MNSARLHAADVAELTARQYSLGAGDVACDAPGDYHCDVQADTPGAWVYKYECSDGGVQVTSPDQPFTVFAGELE